MCIMKKITPFKVRHEHVLLWLLWQLTCRACQCSSSLPAASAWPEPRISPKKRAKEKCKRGGGQRGSFVEVREICLIAVQPSRLNGLQEAPTSNPWSCKPREVQESLCPPATQRSNHLVLWMPPQSLLVKCRFIPACKVAWHDYNF